MLISYKYNKKTLLRGKLILCASLQRNAVGKVLSEKKNNGASCQRVINVWDDCIVEVFKSMKSLLLTNDHLLSFANWQKETKF